ncbi:MAG: WYL domain-containing protein [Ilumatobacteraceae bacterium]
MTTKGTGSGRRRGPRGAADRVSGLLVMLPWLMERKRVKLADMAEQFKMSESELMDDLMMAAVCGVPPYSPDALIDVFIDEDEVVAEVPLLFSRPLRLNTAEVFALTSMGKAALQLPGSTESGPLATALAKLRRLLPSTQDLVEIDLAPVRYVDQITAAVESGEQLRITYFSPARAQRSERSITPRKVFEDGGHWYVAADDDGSGEQRVFRIDRIEALEHTSSFSLSASTAAVGDLGDESEWFGDSLQQVTLRVQPRARWVVESYPYMSRIKNSDGSVDITMAVSSEHWLGRLLLRAGTSVSVLEPVGLRDVAKRSAIEVLKRYG